MHHNLHEVAELLRSGKVKYVLFDLDGTLYESSAGIEAQLRDAMVAQAAIALNTSREESRVLLRQYRGLYKASVLGLQEYHGVDPVRFYEDVYNSLDTSRMQVRPGCGEVLSDLAKHVPIGVFTNSNRTFTEQTLSFLGLSGIFDHVVTVEDHGFIRKPEVEAYHRIFELLQLAPDEVVMFDDIASSLEVMGSLGSNGILVSNGLRPYPSFVDLHTDIEYDGPPSHVVASSHDIVGFISELNRMLARA